MHFLQNRTKEHRENNWRLICTKTKLETALRKAVEKRKGRFLKMNLIKTQARCTVEEVRGRGVAQIAQADVVEAVARSLRRWEWRRKGSKKTPALLSRPHMQSWVAVSCYHS